MKCTCTSEGPHLSALPCLKVTGRSVISLWVPLTLRRIREKQMYGKENWSSLLALSSFINGARRAEGENGS